MSNCNQWMSSEDIIKRSISCDANGNVFAQGGVLNEIEVTQYMSGLTTPLSSAQRMRLNTFVKALKTGLVVHNLSDVFDGLYIFNNETQEAALKNIIKDAHHCTAIDTPAFTAFEGFASNGTSSYLDSNYNPATQGVRYAKDSATQGFYSRRAETPTGTQDPLGVINTNISIMAWTDVLLFYYVNHASPDIACAYENDGLGLFTASRTNAAGLTLYKNKIANPTGVAASTNIPNGNMFILAENLVGTGARRFFTGQLSMVYFAKGLTQGQINVLVDCYDAYLNSLVPDGMLLITEEGDYITEEDNANNLIEA